MKLSTAISLVLALALGVLALWWWSGGDSTRTGLGSWVGEGAFDGVAGVELRDEGGRSLRIARDPERGWVLPDVQGLPANFARLQDLLRQLREARIERVVGMGEDAATELGLGRQSIRLTDAAGGTLWAADFATTEDPPRMSGRVRGEERIVLLERPVPIEARPREWIDRHPLDNLVSGPGRIRGIRLRWPGAEESLVLTRPAPGEQLVAEGLADGEHLAPGAASRLLHELYQAWFARHVGADDPQALQGLSEPAVILDLSLDDGRTMTWTIGPLLGAPPGRWVRLESGGAATAWHGAGDRARLFFDARRLPVPPDRAAFLSGSW